MWLEAKSVGSIILIIIVNKKIKVKYFENIFLKIFLNLIFSDDFRRKKIKRDNNKFHIFFFCLKEQLFSSLIW